MHRYENLCNQNFIIIYTFIYLLNLIYYIFFIGSTESKRAIILIPDIFGWNSGRTRKIADYLASQGYYVMVPRLITPTAYKHKEDECMSIYYFFNL